MSKIALDEVSRCEVKYAIQALARDYKKVGTVVACEGLELSIEMLSVTHDDKEGMKVWVELSNDLNPPRKFYWIASGKEVDELIEDGRHFNFYSDEPDPIEFEIGDTDTVKVSLDRDAYLIVDGVKMYIDYSYKGKDTWVSPTDYVTGEEVGRVKVMYTIHDIYLDHTRMIWDFTLFVRIGDNIYKADVTGYCVHAENCEYDNMPVELTLHLEI
jgi:hypothetical protein